MFIGLPVLIYIVDLTVEQLKETKTKTKELLSMLQVYDT
jgi:hypothetical protein